MMSLAPEMEAFGQGFGVAQSFFVDEPPKVMLGVTMAPPSPEQARDLGLDPSKATVFGTVIEGLPAAKAGLRASDIVVGVDGADDASQEALREKLATLEPGQVLTLKVARDGRVEEVRVELEAYDPERLGMPSQVWVGEMFEGDDPELQALRDEQERVKGEWAEALERSLNADGQRARARAAAEATKLQEQMQDLTTRIARRMSKRAVTEFFNNQSPMGLEMRVAPQVMNDREGNLIIVPQITPTPPGAPSPRGLGGSEDVLRERDARIRELEERLGAMQEKMERLESLLQELKARSGDE